MDQVSRRMLFCSLLARSLEWTGWCAAAVYALALYVEAWPIMIAMVSWIVICAGTITLLDLWNRPKDDRP